MDTIQNRLAGYAFLIEQYGLSALPNWHTSSVSPTGTLRSTIQDGQVESVYPQSYWPGDGTGDHLDDLGRMTLPGETGRLYRYMDMTAQAEALYDFVQRTIEHELVEELDFLSNYDRTKQAIQEIVDMPDRLIDLFIQLCLQNNGRLSAKKREAHFGFLNDDELAHMENAVREG